MFERTGERADAGKTQVMAEEQEGKLNTVTQR